MEHIPVGAPTRTFVLGRDGDIPNSRLPLVVRPRALPPALRNPGGCQALFARNGWGGNWVDGILDDWHFHVTGHEVLGCVAGSARVGFGGDNGVELEIAAGDVVIIPAGVGHKRLSAKRDGFTIVGGYPPDQSGEIVRAGAIDVDEAERRIARLERPRTDPLSGPNGDVTKLWGSG